jgi:hypothetical protein
VVLISGAAGYGRRRGRRRGRGRRGAAGAQAVPLRAAAVVPAPTRAQGRREQGPALLELPGPPPSRAQGPQHGRRQGRRARREADGRGTVWAVRVGRCGVPTLPPRLLPRSLPPAQQHHRGRCWLADALRVSKCDRGDHDAARAQARSKQRPVGHRPCIYRTAASTQLYWDNSVNELVAHTGAVGTSLGASATRPASSSSGPRLPSPSPQSLPWGSSGEEPSLPCRPAGADSRGARLRASSWRWVAGQTGLSRPRSPHRAGTRKRRASCCRCEYYPSAVVHLMNRQGLKPFFMENSDRRRIRFPRATKYLYSPGPQHTSHCRSTRRQTVQQTGQARHTHSSPIHYGSTIYA